MAKIDQTQYPAIRLSVTTGEIIQQHHSETAEMYRNGITQPEIAQFLEEKPRLEPIKSLDVIEHGVRFAFIGNNISTFGNIYEGLIPIEEYREIAKNNIASNVLNLTKSQREKKHIFGALARGQRPWYDLETDLLIELKSQGLGNTEISRNLNDIVHAGEQVRSNNAVYEKIRRINGKKNASKRK